MKDRYFYIKDIDTTITVEYVSRKEMLEWIDDYVRGILDGYATGADDSSYDILYQDGSTDYIDEEYDGHRIRRQGIASVVNSNPSTYMVYGHFEMNEYGVASAAFEDRIDSDNIVEVETEE